VKFIDVSEERMASIFRVEVKNCACHLLIAGFLLGMFFSAEDGGWCIYTKLYGITTQTTAVVML
jgi:hypothetical protein